MSFGFESKTGAKGAGVSGHNVFLANEDGTRDVAGGQAQSGDLFTGLKLFIKWQDGPVDRTKNENANGTFVEDVLEVCRNRLLAYQQSRFNCEENAQAISHIQAAIQKLIDRRARMGTLPQHPVQE